MSKQPHLLMIGLFASSCLIAQAPAPEIEEISVIGQFVPDEKRGTDQIANVVGEQQFQRSGDSNIAESLKRVSGLSTVGGKYVYVRGLGARYATTLLNGAILPSPEPINRVVPMDLFPTSVLDSVLVQKTYSAAYPGEFGGGVLQLRTKKSSDEFFWDFASTVSGVEGSTFGNGYTLQGGGTDWLGKDDGYRQPSAILKQATGNAQKLTKVSKYTGVGVAEETLVDIGKGFNNQYSPDIESVPANFGFNTSVGNSHEIGSRGVQLNYVASGAYSNTWDTNEIERNTYVKGSKDLNLQEAMKYKGTENSIDLSGIFSAGIDFNDSHNVRFTSVVLRKTDDIVARSSGYTESADELEVTEIEWIERELISNQIQGDHYFPGFNDLVLNWRYSEITASRDAPDNRVYRRDSGEFSSRVDGNLRNFSVLEDEAEEFGVDLSMSFYMDSGLIITPQSGMVSSRKKRDSEIRRYGFAFNGAIANDAVLLQKSMEEILAPENIQANGFQIRELTRPTDSYEAASELDALYAQIEFNFDEQIRLTVGGRQEDFIQNSNTFDLFMPELGNNAELANKKFLPSLSATVIRNDHQFRLAYSETVSRPDFRELSTAPFTNPSTGKTIVGNPNLRITSITNIDFRWEWYFDFSDYVSVGLFYKEFVDPIERSILDPINRQSTYINAGSAENQGIEIELYKGLGFLGDGFFNGIGEDFYIQSNLSFIDSTIEIREEDRGSLTTLSRPLQGQSDWLFNAQIGYEPFSGTTATLLYHYYGDRIAEVGIERAPDLVEDGFGELNFVFVQEFENNWRLTLKARNIMDERREITQGGYVADGYFDGRELSIQAQYRFD